MRPLKLGLCLVILEDPLSGSPPRWDEIRRFAVCAEEVGFDTVWIPDELLWRVPGWPGPRGFWECVAMAAAVAASTTRIGIGTWVMASLHRNPGLLCWMQANDSPFALEQTGRLSHEHGCATRSAWKTPLER